MKSKRIVSMEPVERRLLMAVVSVLNTNDAGAGSLREAISAAASGDTIDLTAVSGTITLATGEIAIDKNLSLTGPGASALSISGNDASRVFWIAETTTVSMSDLTITHGTADLGAGINSRGALTLNRVVVSNCTATYGGGGIEVAGPITLNDCTIVDNLNTSTGAGINAWASVTMNRSTIANNTVLAPTWFDEETGDHPGFGTGGGLAIWSGGGTLTNCTFTENYVSGDAAGEQPGFAQGGAIYVAGSGDFAMLNCTVAGNSADGGDPASSGGIYLASGVGTRTFTNCIIADNASFNSEVDFLADITATSGGNNLIGQVISSTVFVNGVKADKVGTTENPINPLLDLLLDNGGTTLTRALLPGSPAINAGDINDAPAADQRGQARVEAADIGAFESTNRAPAFTSNPVTSGTARLAYTYNITVSDQDSGALAISADTLPAWLALVDHANGTATLSGTPTLDNVGDHNISLFVSDGSLTVAQSFTISVAPPRYFLDANGILLVNGDAANNSIHVWLRQGSIRMDLDGTIKNFALASVQSVEVYGFDGNDTIELNTGAIPTYALGGAHNDTLIGGDQFDNLVGGGGKDNLSGGLGADRLDGGTGNDTIAGNDGDDRLYGSDGNDVLVGGGGKDRLYGGLGDDLFLTRGDKKIDNLYGGGGNDRATYDELLDHLTDVLPA